MVQFEPTNGVAYPLRLGESVASDHFASDVISCALRLDFLPASINPHSEGVLEYDKCEHTVRTFS